MMMKGLIAGLGSSFLLTMTLTPAAMGQVPEAGVGEDCLLELSPSSITRQDEPIEIRTDFPLALGTITSIEVEEASGLSTPETPVQEAGSLSFAIDGSEAEPGAWILVFQSDGGECRAVLKVD